MNDPVEQILGAESVHGLSRASGFTLATADPEPTPILLEDVQRDVDEVVGALEKDHSAFAREISGEIRAALLASSPEAILARIRWVLIENHDRLVMMLASASAAAGLLGLARLAQHVPGMQPLEGMVEPAATIPPGQVAGPARKLVEDAAARLRSGRVLGQGGIDQEIQKATNTAEEDARRLREATEQALRDALAETTEEGGDLRSFRGKVREKLEEASFLAPAKVETVFRSNVLGAYSRSRLELVHGDPQVGAQFPYVAYHATHDDRVRETHKKLETLGLDGTNIYRADDPTFQKFRPPFEWNCRCLWSPLTVAQAAAAGVQEAKKWLETGQAPGVPQFVTPPDFEPDPAYQRELSVSDPSDPLEILLAAESVAEIELAFLSEEERTERLALEVMQAVAAGEPISPHRKRQALEALSRLNLEQLARLREKAGLRLDPAKKAVVEELAQEAACRIQ